MYAWNPLVLFDLVGNTHNDVAMLALLVLGLAIQGGGNGARASGGSRRQQQRRAVARRRQRRRAVAGALVSITLSALVKFGTGVVALVWSVAYAAGGASWAARLGGWRVAGASGWRWRCVVVAVAGPAQAFLPFADAAGGRLVINSAPDLVALFVADNVLVPLGVAQPEHSPRRDSGCAC